MSCGEPPAVPEFAHHGPGTTAETWSADAAWDTVAEVDLDGFERVVVVAAHPDDETLGAGGLTAVAAAAGLPVHLLVCTAGEASHPRSRTHPPHVLARRRSDEVRAAFGTLAPGGTLTALGLADGRLEESERALTNRLVQDLRDARTTLLVAPWRRDGHPDHEAAGRAAATAALRTGATLWEYPLWWWHWAHPSTAPWQDVRRLRLPEDAVRSRARALAHHRSQTEALSDEPGDEALLLPGVLAHFTGPTERFVVQPPTDDALDRLHRDEADPWGVSELWYEKRKRALTLALLPRERFRRVLEVGCSVGELTADLAARCEAVVAVDSSAAAVRAARQRLVDATPTRRGDRGGHRVDVRHATVPEQWPEGDFDLVVVSEVGYFLSPSALDGLIERIRGSLRPDGVLVLCHWRHPVEGWPLSADDVHEAFVGSGLRPVQARHVERDFEAVVLSTDSAWVRTDP